MAAAGTLLMVFAACASAWSPGLASPAMRRVQLARPLTFHISMCLEAKERPSTSAIAEMLEASFVRACMDAARGYVDTLKLFIVAAKAGYEFGAPIPEVSAELNACERKTAGRPLMPEEVELRLLWVCLVYLTLTRLSHPTEGAAGVGDSVPSGISAKHAPLVDGVVCAYLDGRPLKALKLADFLTPPTDAIETAVLSQSTLTGPFSLGLRPVSPPVASHGLSLLLLLTQSAASEQLRSLR